MLASDLIDKTYLEWLHPAGVEQPDFDTLNGAIDDSVTTVTLNGRLEFVPQDAVIEIDSELLLVKGTTGSALTIAERGYGGTTPASHSDGVIVKVDPVYPRVSVLNAINEIVGTLYPWGLFKRGIDTTLTFDGDDLLDLPAGTDEVLDIYVERSDGTGRYRVLEPHDWEVLHGWDPPKLQLHRGGAEGAAMRVVYTGDFGDVDAEAADLDDAGVPAKLQPKIPFAAAGHLLQAHTGPQLQMDEIRTKLAAEGVQVGAGFNIGQQMLQAFINRYVLAERMRQSKKDSPRIVRVRS